MLEKPHAYKLLGLFMYFCLLAYMLWRFDIGYAILPLLVLSAIGWLEYEWQKDPKHLAPVDAVKIGFFLMVFDFAVENAGASLGLWHVVESGLFVLAVPIEIMLLALFGGTAWALAQPKKFSRINSALDIALFSVFGMIGEFLLIKNGIMEYSGGWTSLHALAGYVITWCILLFVRYRVFVGNPSR